MKQFDDAKKYKYAKRFVNASYVYTLLFLFSVALYRIGAFEANTWVYLFFWFLNVILIYVSYKEDVKYKFYGKNEVLLFAYSLPVALLVILL